MPSTQEVDWIFSPIVPGKSPDLNREKRRQDSNTTAPQLMPLVFVQWDRHAPVEAALNIVA
jgi:hypothetical protein